MITRRSALTMLPAGLMAGSSFTSPAWAQAIAPIFRPNTNAAREILSKVDAGGRTAHHEATKALIQSYIRIATLRNTAGDTRRNNSKAELIDALAQNEAMHGAVTVAIDSRKKTDDIIDKETGPMARRLSEGDKIKLGSAVDIKNNEVKQILNELFAGQGDFDIKRVPAARVNRLNALSEELLRAGRDMATWGPDAFYAMARGYASFQFVRYCTRVGTGPATIGSSAILARAYTLKVIGDSESYCAFQAAALASPNPPPITPPPGTPTPGQLSWTDRHDVEKDIINKRFPKEIYLGSMTGRDARCDSPGRRIRNYYGLFTDNSNFDRGFRSDGVSASDCVSVLNDRKKEALNNLLSERLKFPGPTTGTLDQFKDTMRTVEQSLNDHIAFLKRQKDKENPGGGAGPPNPPPLPSDASNEFKVMQQMASYLREVLALT